MQLFVCLVFGLDGDEQGGGVSEVIIDHKGDDTGRQFGFEVLQPVTDF